VKNLNRYPKNERKKLTEKIKRIEALFAGATTDGERDAAFNALQKIRDRLSEIKQIE